jgi:hypothetical protein
MLQSDDEIRSRATELAEEAASGIRQGRAVEWLEEVLGTALLDVVRRERERCAAVVEHRIEMWESSMRRMVGGSWPPAALAEARARLNEARALADALRVSVSPPPEGQ